MPRAGLTADIVTVAAAELADEVGFDGITVSALARRFGVRDASLYSHVRGVEDLRRRVAELATREFADRLSPAVAGRAGREALLAFGRAYRSFALEHPGRYAAAQLQLPADSRGRRRVTETCAAVMRVYQLTEPDLTDAVRLLHSTLHGFVSLEAVGGFGDPRDIAASLDRALCGLHALLDRWQYCRATTPSDE